MCQCCRIHLSHLETLICLLIVSNLNCHSCPWCCSPGQGWTLAAKTLLQGLCGTRMGFRVLRQIVVGRQQLKKQGKVAGGGWIQI